MVILLDNVAGGTSWEQFYDSYPDLTPEMVNPVLEWQNDQAHRLMGLDLAS